MEAVHSRLHGYTRDLRPFIPGADVNENAAIWQTFEASLVSDVSVLANVDGDCLAIPAPPGDDYTTQKRILLRLPRKFTSGESRVIVDSGVSMSKADTSALSDESIVLLRLNFRSR